MENIKFCPQCKQWKTITEFSKNTSRKDGHQSWCKECEKQRNKEWYTKNKKKKCEYSRKYHTTLRGYCNNIRQGNIKEDRKYNRIPEDHLPQNYPTLDDYMTLIQERDFYDGKLYNFWEMGVDRIDNSKPHTLDNIVPCSTKNNISRGRKNFEDFYYFKKDNRL